MSNRRAVQKRYRDAHPETCKLSDTTWRAKDPQRAAELDRASTRRHYQRHRERILALQHSKYRRGTERPRLSDKEKAEASALYATSLTFKEIGDRLKRTGGTVARYLRTVESIRARPVKSGPGAVGWKGGRVLSHGYIYVWLPPDDPMACMRDQAGRVAEHRLVLARKLERPLLDSETVHHINGHRSENHPDNLELRNGKHGKGIVLACLDCGSHRIGPVTTSTITEDQ
jgi:DNA-binding CsgD family transcriptional regulator